MSISGSRRLRIRLVRTPTISKQEPFRFQDLSAELRNRVYVAYLRKANVTCFLAATGRGKVFTNDPLAHVSRAVRGELEYQLHHATFDHNIIAVVNNFDFRHIVTFLNSLSNAKVDNIMQESNYGNFIIELTFQEKFVPLEARKLLLRWLNRFDDPRKKDTALDAVYTIEDHLRCPEEWKIKAMRHNLGGHVYNRRNKSKRSTLRQQEEMDKICHAIIDRNRTYLQWIS